MILAEDSATSIAGNFLGDFVKGQPEGRFPPAIVTGIRLHRSLDVYTDSHPAVRRAVRRLPLARRRFGRIALDLAFDHFLARCWQAEAPATFRAFRGRIYARLEADAAAMPPCAQRVAAVMAAEDWFLGYAHWDGIADALAAMSRRLSRPNPLAETIHDLRDAESGLADDFATFWPDIRAYARTTRAC